MCAHPPPHMCILTLVHTSPHMCILIHVCTCTCIRLMLGVQSSPAPPGFLVEPCGGAGLADWELDRLMWSRTVENVATATTTITSLAQLLDQIGNIVINDNIASQVMKEKLCSLSFAGSVNLFHYINNKLGLLLHICLYIIIWYCVCHYILYLLSNILL